MLENKKILLTILFVLILLIIPNLVLAEGEFFATTEINGVTANWQYNLNEANEIIKLKCINPTSLTGNITIPSELDGKTVIQLGDEAFKGATNITGATIPSSVKEIGYSAFANCEKLTNVDLGKVELIGHSAFKGCTSLKSIVIPNTIKRSANIAVFQDCINLTNITFEEGLTIIPSCLCEGTEVTEITIPSSVKEIGYSAFANCEKLTNVDLGKVELIGHSAFKGCTSLKSIVIPNTIKRSANIAVFQDCINLTNITFEEGLTIIPSCLCKGTEVTEITIPSSVEKIGYSAFEDCKSLKKITILDNVTYFGGAVFKNHNEDLTIYCYKDSEAAKYAIENDIKYVYLTRPEASALKEIVIEKVANKVDYKVGEKFDKTGMIVKAVYEDGTSKQIENYSINPNTALKLSDTKVTISYTENGVTKEATHKIRVINSSGKVENIDNTTAPGEMPYTGGTFFIILTVIGIATVAIYVYKRNNDLRGI